MHHIVSRDESLYAIAWRYELDFQRLAAINGLQPPYSLHTGQKLSLDMSGAPARPNGYSTVRAQPVPPSRAEPVATRAAPVQPRGADRATAQSQTAPPPAVAVTEPPMPAAGWSWQWPARGRVSREYDAGKALKGISIYTDSGAPVAAAAPGVVVYAGEGLRGYGRLIIVKHSDQYLSAYAHNNRILVEENQSVQQGQQIAEVGLDHGNQYRLYFEIRENGKPVDPLNRLPK